MTHRHTPPPPKTRPSNTQLLHGTVKRVVQERGFGFISATDGQEYFFHRSMMTDASQGGFSLLNVGDKVRFTVEDGDSRGPRAGSVERV